jgi:hypothetical protein
VLKTHQKSILCLCQMMLGLRGKAFGCAQIVMLPERTLHLILVEAGSQHLLEFVDCPVLKEICKA